MQNCELLSPAGNMDALRAAVQNGADAVYFGAGDFNARRNAENFGDTLDAAVSYCHIRGARAFITLNTMVREDEFPRLIKTVESIASAGADGLIVQDLGVADAVHTIAPDIELHASTQMAVHNASGVEFLMKKGFHRIVLAREMTLDEIRTCAKTGAELEVFVHGALCVSCSGLCLLSSMIGGRSGNRGLCAQPCRMQYSSGTQTGYLLSTRDLCALKLLPELYEAGVFSYKLEGRLKRPEYVGLTTRIYREALNAAASGEAFNARTRIEELRQMFNRGGFSDAYLTGVKETELMYPDRPNHVGVPVGRCEKDGRIALDLPVASSDTLILRRNEKDIPLRQGALSKGPDLREARRGDVLYRLVSQTQMENERSILEKEPLRVPITAVAELHIGKPAKLALSDGTNSICVTGDPVVPARSGCTDVARITAQIEKTGDTPYRITDTRIAADDAAFLPVSSINALRREACGQLNTVRAGGPHAVYAYKPTVVSKNSDSETRLMIQSATPSILRRALECGAQRVGWRPEDLRLNALNAASELLPENFDLILPPVTGEATLNTLSVWADHMKSRIVRTWISNIGQLDHTWPGTLWGDAPLNIANNASVGKLLSFGLEGYTPSVELNCAQLRELSGRTSLIVHGRLPLMELRHCPYRSTHALRGRHCDCRHCDKAASGDRLNDMVLTDRTGAAFPLRRIASEEGCVIELLNSAELVMLKRMDSLPKCECIRLLLTEDDPVEALLSVYRDALRGNDIRSDEAYNKIEITNYTTGHFFRGVQ